PLSLLLPSSPPMASSCRSCLVWVLCFFLCRCLVFVEPSRRVFLYPQSQEISSIVSKQYRTAYHFQPPKNWINGSTLTNRYQ
ncbi:unnamed protein product, partial [Musa banksii]